MSASTQPQPNPTPHQPGSAAARQDLPAARKGPSALHLRLPATSANLGPGFDALGLAMALYLTIDATPSDAFAIEATGRHPDLTGRVKNNLICSTYSGVLTANNRAITPLKLRLHNEIPLGMGCGSSAAALLAGVFLANHFGQLHWNQQQILEEACRREGHPDNVAACFHGGMTASLPTENKQLQTVTCGLDLPWRLTLALPSKGLATEKARALLPPTYSRADAVANLQRTAQLVLAFALNRPDLLRLAMQDSLHQPFRMAACPLLPRALTLSNHPEILGIALSGAGPAILFLTNSDVPDLSTLIQTAIAPDSVEIVTTTLAPAALCIAENIGKSHD